MKKEKKTERFEMVMTPTEKQQLEKLSIMAGLSSAQFLRVLIRREYRKPDALVYNADDKVA